MKKVISLVMALVMMMAVMVPAFAADLSANPDSADVIINTSTLKDTDGDGVGETEAEGYTVTIPADTTIPWGTEETDVSYTVESHLKRDGRVKVTVAGAGVMKTTDGAYEIAYALVGEGAAFNSTVPTIYPAAEKTVTVSIPADNWNSAVVEEYKDILTYTAEIERV
ncbi:MAG: hypothetical protein IIV47_01080 [Clostridia bacterium]|nr:hypothetical protein [Clostridia bacterium]